MTEAMAVFSDQVLRVLVVALAVLTVAGCSGSGSPTKTTTADKPSSSLGSPTADKKPAPAAPPTAEAPKTDVQGQLGKLNTFLKDNYTGTTWFSQFSEVKLSTSGTSATITVQTTSAPKESNRETAKNACRGAMMSGVETLEASKITVAILAEGGSELTRCWADVANGKLATPMQFSN